MPRVALATAEEAEAYLLGLINYEAKTHYIRDTTTHDLGQFRRRLLGMGWNPLAVPTIHIGGTNGKGSVAMLTEALLRGGGKSTGLFTSPHLVDIRERIQLQGKPISRDLFRELIQDLANGCDPSARGIRTTFEHLTAAAFLAFQRAEVDWAVIEVGLGGRLDATNILPSGKAVLTPISLDHENVLGSTLQVIARDKAHILKAGGEAWVMAQTPEALKAIGERLAGEDLVAMEPSNRVSVTRVSAHEAGSDLSIRGREDYGRVTTQLLGSHQLQNLSTALAVCETILSPEAMRKSLGRLRDVVLPGRLQVIKRFGKTFLIDGGHNPGAAHAIRCALETHFPGAKVVVVVGMAKDKNVRAFLEILAPVTLRLVGTASTNPRAATGSAVAALAPGDIPSQASETVDEALGHVAGSREELILVTGSFIVAGEALAWLG